MKRERCQPTRSEEYVLPFPQPLPVGELLAKCKPAIFRKAEDIELLIVQEFRGADLPSIHLDSVQVVGLRGCCLGRGAGVYVTSNHGPLIAISSCRGRPAAPQAGSASSALIFLAVRGGVLISRSSPLGGHAMRYYVGEPHNIHHGEHHAAILTFLHTITRVCTR